MQTKPPLLHVPSTRVIRQDWLDVARATLVSRGVEGIKIVSLAAELNVSRSSFYWFFRDRADLLAQLVDLWHDSNTEELVRHAARESRDVVDGVFSIFEIWTEGARFDPQLDFAVREWARRDGALHALVRREDDIRVGAIAAMFCRHGMAESEAFIRARILYFMQLGYFALDIQEPLEDRLGYTADYVACFSGVRPTDEDVATYHAFVRSQPLAQPSNSATTSRSTRGKTSKP